MRRSLFVRCLAALLALTTSLSIADTDGYLCPSHGSAAMAAMPGMAHDKSNAPSHNAAHHHDARCCTVPCSPTAIASAPVRIRPAASRRTARLAIISASAQVVSRAPTLLPWANGPPATS